jgi:hypothetical protein
LKQDYIKNKSSEYGLYLMALVFFFVLVGQIIQSQLKPGNFVKVEGIVTKANEIETSSRRGGRSTALTIYLDNSDEYFRLRESDRYYRFRTKVQPGTRVIIYTRPEWLATYGLGQKNDVFRLVANGEIVFERPYKKWYEGQISIIAMIAIPLLILLARWVRPKTPITK